MVRVSTASQRRPRHRSERRKFLEGPWGFFLKNMFPELACEKGMSEVYLYLANSATYSRTVLYHHANNIAIPRYEVQQFGYSCIVPPSYHGTTSDD